MAMKGKHSPWLWIPTLYVAEGLPYFAVNTLTVLMYVRMGISNAEMAFYTGWLYLPWVIKPFWSPFVDIIRTKRWWVLLMEALMALSLASVAFLMPTSVFFSATLACFWLTAFFSATHDIAADGYYMLELTAHDQAAFVGIRSTFYRVASVLGQGGLVMLAGYLEETLGDIPMAWAAVFALVAVFFLLITLYHLRFMPKAAADKPRRENSAAQLARNFVDTFITFVAKPGVGPAICFMLLYRLPEALCVKLVQPFLVASREAGGLGLTTKEVGFVNGTVGVIALLLGGIVGGLAIARQGLKAWLWPMALSLTLPCIFYCLLAMWQPESFFWINAAVFTEQFGYGFGFTAFMLYLIYFSRGENRTSHYAFCTAFMALGMMLPGMAAGWLHQVLEGLQIFPGMQPQGYVNFFWVVMLCCVATFAVCAIVKISPEFGRKELHDSGD